MATEAHTLGKRAYPTGMLSSDHNDHRFTVSNSLCIVSLIIQIHPRDVTSFLILNRRCDPKCVPSIVAYVNLVMTYVIFKTPCLMIIGHLMSLHIVVASHMMSCEVMILNCAVKLL